MFLRTTNQLISGLHFGSIPFVKTTYIIPIYIIPIYQLADMQHSTAYVHKLLL
jgi:hypothetical protein